MAKRKSIGPCAKKCKGRKISKFRKCVKVCMTGRKSKKKRRRR